MAYVRPRLVFICEVLANLICFAPYVRPCLHLTSTSKRTTIISLGCALPYRWLKRGCTSLSFPAREENQTGINIPRIFQVYPFESIFFQAFLDGNLTPFSPHPINFLVVFYSPFCRQAEFLGTFLRDCPGLFLILKDPENSQRSLQKIPQKISIRGYTLRRRLRTFRAKAKTC